MTCIPKKAPDLHFFLQQGFKGRRSATKAFLQKKKELLISFIVLQILTHTHLTLSPIFHNVAKILREITYMKKIDGFLCDRIEHFFKERTDLHFNGILPKGKYDHCVWTYWICIADQDFCKGHEFFHWFFYVKSKVCTWLSDNNSTDFYFSLLSWAAQLC